MNGLHLLIAAIAIGSLAFIISKIYLYKQSAQFWKDSCYMAMEKYNNLLVEKQMGKTIEKVFENKSLDVN